MKFTFLLCIFLIFSSNLVTVRAQNTEANRLLKEADQSLYTNPRKSIKLYQYLSKSVEKPKASLRISIKKLTANRLLGNYQEAVEISQEVKSQLDSFSDPQLDFEYWLQMAALYHALNLDRESKQALRKAKQLYSEFEKHQKEKYFLEVEYASINLSKKTIANKKIAQLKRISQTKSKNKSLQSLIDYQIGILYYKTNRDSAKVYFNKALEQGKSASFSKLVEVQKNLLENNTLADSLVNNVSNYKTFNKHLKIVFLEHSIQYWKEKQEIDSLVKYTKMLEEIQHKEHLKKRRAKVILLETIYQHKKEEQLHKTEKTQVRLRLAIAVLILLVLGYFGYSFFGNKKKNQAKETTEPKGIVIPDKTEAEILEKLKQFEASSLFLNKKIRLATLAKHLDTNTRYLSTIINASKDKSFNMYINSLRINYITKKLHTDPKYANYKISYLANESGFASQSSFTTAFKEVTGFTPSVYIKKKLD